MLYNKCYSMQIRWLLFAGANCVRPPELQHTSTGEHSSPLQNKRKIPCFQS